MDLGNLLNNENDLLEEIKHGTKMGNTYFCGLLKQMRLKLSKRKTKTKNYPPAVLSPPSLSLSLSLSGPDSWSLSVRHEEILEALKGKFLGEHTERL